MTIVQSRTIIAAASSVRLFVGRIVQASGGTAALNDCFMDCFLWFVLGVGEETRVRPAQDNVYGPLVVQLAKGDDSPKTQ